MRTLFAEIPYIHTDRLILQKVTDSDAAALDELRHDQLVYRYLPLFLFEQRFEDVHEVISRLYDEALDGSLILGIYMDGQFCGLMELYGHRPQFKKISVGYRLLRSCWKKGIASEALGGLLHYLEQETSIKVITASTMVENRASSHVLLKNGFVLTAHAFPEDWGYPEPTLSDKWIRSTLPAKKLFH